VDDDFCKTFLGPILVPKKSIQSFYHDPGNIRTIFLSVPLNPFNDLAGQFNGQILGLILVLVFCHFGASHKFMADNFATTASGKQNIKSVCDRDPVIC
jgi:hypothetical protein